MTPQEKAEELFKKAQDCQWVDAEYGMDDTTAKQCALFVVDEIYDLRLTYGQHLEYDEDKINYYSYWEQVKQEIDKL